MYKTEKLERMPYAQAHIIRRPNAVILVSYTTRVAAIVGGQLVCNGLYSQTTRKHIGAFCRQFGTDYQTAKMCYEMGVTMDIVTGEIVEQKVDLWGL
jgi:hypothetical protein